MASGPRIVGTCICEEYQRQSLEPHFPRMFFPGWQPWLAVTRIAHAVENLIPDRAAEGAPEELRLFGRPQDWEGAERLGIHSLRRGAAGAISAAGFFSPAPLLRTVALASLPTLPGLGSRRVPGDRLDTNRRLRR